MSRRGVAGADQEAAGIADAQARDGLRSRTRADPPEAARPRDPCTRARNAASSLARPRCCPSLLRRRMSLIHSSGGRRRVLGAPARLAESLAASFAECREPSPLGPAVPAFSAAQAARLRCAALARGWWTKRRCGAVRPRVAAVHRRSPAAERCSLRHLPTVAPETARPAARRRRCRRRARRVGVRMRNPRGRGELGVCVAADRVRSRRSAVWRAACSAVLVRRARRAERHVPVLLVAAALVASAARLRCASATGLAASREAPCCASAALSPLAPPHRVSRDVRGLRRGGGGGLAGAALRRRRETRAGSDFLGWCQLQNADGEHRATIAAAISGHDCMCGARRPGLAPPRARGGRMRGVERSWRLLAARHSPGGAIRRFAHECSSLVGVAHDLLAPPGPTSHCATCSLRSAAGS